MNTITVAEVSVKELAQLREDAADHLVLDVREPNEYDICNIGGKLIPLAQLPERIGELNPEQLTIIHCRSGGRSRRAAEFLINSGFKNVKNLKGGITAWREEVDPSLAVY